MTLPTFDRPPNLDDLVKGLERLLRGGLPATEETAEEVLLGLRGVWARSVDADDLLSRVKALNELLGRLIAEMPPLNDHDLADAAAVLFKVDGRARRQNLLQRYESAAKAAGYQVDHFRRAIVPKILRQIARQLHEDSQNYIPRTGQPARQEISGDSPSITEEHISAPDVALREETLSRLWEYVYGLRAELIAIERLKRWPEEEHAALKLEESRDSALWQLGRLMHWIGRYIAEYGDFVEHGRAEFQAEALIRLAGWRGELPPVVATKLRTLAAMYPTREEFIRACQEANLRMGTAGPDQA
ncbi:hypothetical protein [Micromonospora zhanjiangensis]|uniref:Uncharacterized protein n=1 Tax=Micromonospora zhanjiangensis TaxID=1522057 RepID=A0ABV8KL45_9ACTN